MEAFIPLLIESRCSVETITLVVMEASMLEQPPIYTEERSWAGIMLSLR